MVHSFILSCLLAVRNFVLIPQHTSPDCAVKEVDALYDVVADVRNRWNTEVTTFLHFLHTHLIFSGTHNGGCKGLTWLNMSWA